MNIFTCHSKRQVALEKVPLKAERLKYASLARDGEQKKNRTSRRTPAGASATLKALAEVIFILYGICARFNDEKVLN